MSPAWGLVTLSVRDLKMLRARGGVMEPEALDHVGLLMSYIHDPHLHLVEITTYEISPENSSAGKKPT
jgi:hypothetical protein